MAQLLPAWVPSDALLLGLLVLVAGTLLMNWNKRWTISRVMDLTAPLIVAGGVLLAAMAGPLSMALGVGATDTWIAVGLLIAAGGIVAHASDRVEL